MLLVKCRFWRENCMDTAFVKCSETSLQQPPFIPTELSALKGILFLEDKILYCQKLFLFFPLLSLNERPKVQEMKGMDFIEVQLVTTLLRGFK
ncbi:hypothetical protein AVEN_73466-1 [Araneus ventricosus]|uniref:Uncharacterized protein n=1 Tax=Araneus ventricosus TaxID=182803 RepID=A0A4Y2LXG6_ARAVE|nr:hypothetical protein AVEN_73466-1 [Araneus ventricosus]